MTAKEYLKQAHRLDAQINILIRQKEDLLHMACNITAPQSGDKIKKNKNQEAPFERTIDKVMNLETKINSKIDVLISLKAEMIDALDAMEDEDERMILNYRYFGGLQFEDIADVMHRSLRTIYRLHGYALRHFVVPEDAAKKFSKS